MELDKPSEKTAWFSQELSAKENWDRWLTSAHSQAFERGEISANTFADLFIADNNLGLTSGELLKRYYEWVIGFYPGVFPLLHQLNKRYRLGVFSNITEVHWPEIFCELESQQCFQHLFASYLIGKAKPDPESFLFVAAQMNVGPGEVLFVDDTEINVNGARRAGMRAELVQGFSALIPVLEQHRIQVN